MLMLFHRIFLINLSALPLSPPFLFDYLLFFSLFSTQINYHLFGGPFCKEELYYADFFAGWISQNRLLDIVETLVFFVIGPVHLILVRCCILRCKFFLSLGK